TRLGAGGISCHHLRWHHLPLHRGARLRRPVIPENVTISFAVRESEATTLLYLVDHTKSSLDGTGIEPASERLARNEVNHASAHSLRAARVRIIMLRYC